MTQTVTKTRGLVAAPPTPFTADDQLDLDAVQPLAEHLHHQGVIGVFVNGSTGEGVSLTMDERQEHAAEWRRVLPSGMKLFVHTGHNSLPEARRLTRHAAEIGADAAAAIAPGFFKPANEEQLAEWCARIGADAPDLPFYLYHVPGRSGVNLNVPLLLHHTAERLPNLAGVKYTHEDLAEYQETLRLDHGKYDVLWGRDQMLLGALATGAEGAVGSTYNIAAPLNRKIIAAFEQGDLTTARDLQAQAIRMVNAMVDTGNILATIKILLRRQGVPIQPYTRLPLTPIPENAADGIRVPEG